MKRVNFETDCKMPFKLDYLYRRGNCKSCGLTLQNGTMLSYVSIPDNIRFANASVIRYLKTEEGQELIKSEIALQN